MILHEEFLNHTNHKMTESTHRMAKLMPVFPTIHFLIKNPPDCDFVRSQWPQTILQLPHNSYIFQLDHKSFTLLHYFILTNGPPSNAQLMWTYHMVEMAIQRSRGTFHHVHIIILIPDKLQRLSTFCTLWFLSFNNKINKCQ